jgi:mannose-6-phosphate isomerase-like protein (cupin superfamily)
MARKDTRIEVDGKYKGIKMLFEKAGDSLGLHKHTEADNHWTVFANGTIKLLHPGQPDDGKIINAPFALNFPAGVPHGFEAMTAGAMIFNILKNPVA